MLEIVLIEYFPCKILNILFGNTSLYHYHITNFSKSGKQTILNFSFFRTIKRYPQEIIKLAKGISFLGSKVEKDCPIGQFKESEISNIEFLANKSTLNLANLKACTIFIRN